ncbi:sialin-like [Aphidius gifuensis]|uniref:sialin-like n=1 Tax=Aphidius gifuensis TaxID=684658 RepID=UPI001CDB744D|nr:sialin-like [Aphidius gifuensis]
MDKIESPKFEKDSHVLRDEENQLKIQKDDAWWKFWKKHRIIIAILAFFGFFTLMVLRVNLSIAIIAMTTSDTDEQPEFQWDSRTRGFILSSFFYGYICFQLLGGWLSSRIGGKRVFGYGIGVATLLALLTPPLTRISVYLLIALRIVQGTFEVNIIIITIVRRVIAEGLAVVLNLLLKKKNGHKFLTNQRKNFI